MAQTISWVLFAFTVWGLAILLHALQRRYAPNMERNWHGLNSSDDDGSGTYQSHSDMREENNDLKAEVERLRKRVEVLETIVTDKKYQFEQELNNN